MISYKPGPFESFSKSARKMSQVADRTKRKVFLVLDGVRYVAKPHQGFKGLLRRRKILEEREYFRRYLTPQAREATRAWIINRFNEINTLCAEFAKSQNSVQPTS